MLRKILSVIILAVFAAGCGVKAQTYVMTKERVDQEIEGNGGCLSGRCAQAPAPEKTTRKVYVLEVTKPLAETQVKKIEEEVEYSSKKVRDVSVQVNQDWDEKPARASKPAWEPIDFSGEEEAEAPAKAAQEEIVGPSEDQSYTVQKDDTLQKIAKKFYGSYGKWYKIYEVNKGVINDPNFLKVGTVITIPAVK